MRRVHRLAAVVAACLPVAALAEGTQTGFEFTDFTGSFTVGELPAVTFENGFSASVANPALYHTGFFAWMVDVGETGTITFDPPAHTVNFFAIDQSASTNGFVTFLTPGGKALFAAAIPEEFAPFGFEAPDGVVIGTVLIENTGTSGVVAVDTFSACAEAPNTPIEDPIPGPVPTGQTIRLRPVADGMTAPNWGAFAPGDASTLFVTDQPGVLYAVDLQSGEKSVFLDVSSEIVPMGAFGPDTFDERGLLGVAFHPDYNANGLVYTYESRPTIKGAADFTTLTEGQTPNHQATVNEYMVANPGQPGAFADAGTRRELVRIDQPQFNHDGGAINFGADGMLYVALGDGGAADDQGAGHSPGGNGQDPTNILGTIIRIDPQGSNGVNGEYGVPASNPFVGDGGVLDEIFAYGLRNPFRFSFDMLTGELFCADVGQGDIEEITVINAGDNCGWPVKEGTFLFDQNADMGGFVFADSPGVPAGMADPIAQYDHDEGIAIVGGFVYRGSRIGGLEGRYIFGDFAQNFGGNNGRLFYLDDADTVTEFALEGQDVVGLSVLGLGQDADGEVYLMGNTTGIPFGETGVVLRVAPACPVDLDFSFLVDSGDLNVLLADFGCVGGGCVADLDGDGDTDSADLNILLAAFGDECG